MADTVTAGQPAPRSAATWNKILGAANDYASRQALGQAGAAAPGFLSPAVIKVKNSSGAARRAGDVIQLDAALLTTLDAQHIWLDGVAPAANLWRAFHGVFLRQTPNGSIGDCQVAGVCRAYVNINDTVHSRCDLKAAQYVLESCHAGPWEILWQSSGTGEKLCVVGIGPKRPSTGIAKLGGDLAAGSPAAVTSATATLYRKASGAALETANQTVTVYSWFATGFLTNDYLSVGQNDDGLWWLMTADCSA